MWTVPVIDCLSGKGPFHCWKRGKYDLYFKGCTVIQSCVAAALAAECHFTKQIYTESKMGPVSNASKISRWWWKILRLPLILPIRHRGKPSPEGWNIISVFSRFRIFPNSFTWLGEVSASTHDPQFGQMATGMPHYSQWYWYWKTQMPPVSV